MNRTTCIRTVERFGRWLGRGWRGYVRGERRALRWLVGKGVPVGLATALLWVVKLAVLGVLLYVAFWVALLLFSVVAAGWIGSNFDPDDDVWMKEDEWRYGDAGFGTYTADGHRIAPHNPNAPFDT